MIIKKIKGKEKEKEKDKENFPSYSDSKIVYDSCIVNCPTHHS
jgi:hypothetical protein